VSKGLDGVKGLDGAEKLEDLGGGLKYVKLGVTKTCIVWLIFHVRKNCRTCTDIHALKKNL